MVRWTSLSGRRGQKDLLAVREPLGVSPRGSGRVWEALLVDQERSEGRPRVT